MTTNSADNSGLSRRKRGTRAFTLIEAVLAVAIMSMGGIVLLTAASRCLAVSVAARNLHSAAAVLDKGELDYPLMPTNEISENVVGPTAYGRYTFERAVEPFGGEKDMFVVRTTVSWAIKGKHACEKVETLLYSTNHP